MSTAVPEQVIQRAMDDEAFRNEMLSNPAAALGGYDLSQEERAPSATPALSGPRGSSPPRVC